MRVADRYAELSMRTAAIGPRALTEIQAVSATHGAMGYPVVAGIAAAMATHEDALSAKADDFQRYSQTFTEHAHDYRAQDEAGADQLGGESGEDPRRSSVQAVDHTTFKDAPEFDDDRTRNQIDAFKKVFGRPPTSAADWSTAAALDPHTYDPRFRGTNSEIRVVEITPQPGQGVVRASQWIEQPTVRNVPPKWDFGNNRGPDAHFDPEDTKVTTYIDYENGIVVMRQNPTVEVNADGSAGQVKVGVPQGSVTQTPDGAVRIHFDAGNPLAPPISTNPPWPLTDHPVTVNGDLVFTPGPGGVHVDGTRSDYPSLEVYQDLPGGQTRTVLIDPADSGRSWGPAANLPFHHDVGSGGKAFEPFDRGGWNPKFDVRVPLPATDFGPVTDAPSVPAPPARHGGVPV